MKFWAEGPLGKAVWEDGAVTGDPAAVTRFLAVCKGEANHAIFGFQGGVLGHPPHQPNPVSAWMILLKQIADPMTVHGDCPEEISAHMAWMDALWKRGCIP